MAINEIYSYKDWSGQDFTWYAAEDFSNTQIIGSSFFQPNAPYTEIFPKEIVNVEFIDCNLDNCILPKGSVLTRSTNLQIKVIDGIDCIVNDLGEYVDTLDHYLSIAFWRDI